MSLKKLTRDSKFLDYVDLLKDKMACIEAVDKYSTIKNIETITVGEALDAFIVDKSVSQAWAFWTLKVLGANLAEDVRIGFIEKIKDPMTAFQIYLQLSDLSKIEDALLKEKFDGLLPKAEKELTDEVVLRVKDG